MKSKPVEDPPLGLTPILAVSDAHAAADFYARAFGATELARISAPDSIRLMHVRMTVFGTVFVFMDEIPELAAPESRFHSPDRLNGTSVSLHLQVADAESVWKQAIHAGAVPVIPLAEQFWGELYGRLKDPFGHEWTIAQLLRILGSAEVENAAAGILMPPVEPRRRRSGQTRHSPVFLHHSPISEPEIKRLRGMIRV